MGIAEDNARNPLYQKVEKMFMDKGIVMNTFEMSEEDIFYYLMAAEYPGLSFETSNSFFNTARQLIAG